MYRKGKANVTVNVNDGVVERSSTHAVQKRSKKPNGLVKNDSQEPKAREANVLEEKKETKSMSPLALECNRNEE